MVEMMYKIIEFRKSALSMDLPILKVKYQELNNKFEIPRIKL